MSSDIFEMIRPHINIKNSVALNYMIDSNLGKRFIECYAEYNECKDDISQTKWYLKWFGVLDVCFGDFLKRYRIRDQIDIRVIAQHANEWFEKQNNVLETQSTGIDSAYILAESPTWKADGDMVWRIIRTYFLDETTCMWFRSEIDMGTLKDKIYRDTTSRKTRLFNSTRTRSSSVFKKIFDH